MTDTAPVFSTPEAAETAFYAAFASCDVQAMEAVWANDNVICIHPGATALVGHDAVMRSWTNILLHADPPKLHIEVLNRCVDAELAVHVVKEHIAPRTGTAGTSSVVLATNVYRRDANDAWHLLEHHASVPRSSEQNYTVQ